MISSSFPTDRSSPIVLDASVVINLNATGIASKIIDVFPNPFVVTDVAYRELMHGADNGHGDAEALNALIGSGHVTVTDLLNEELDLFEHLIGGSAPRTLDDGEAATVACAHLRNACAAIDERKAIGLCRDHFPKLRVVETVPIILHSSVVAALGKSALSDGVLKALKMARMRVPRASIQTVVELIGEDKALTCESLPRAVRKAS